MKDTIHAFSSSGYGKPLRTLQLGVTGNIRRKYCENKTWEWYTFNGISELFCYDRPMPLFVTKRIIFSTHDSEKVDDDNGRYIAVLKRQRYTWSAKFILRSGSLYPPIKVAQYSP
jgi:hypothetical protein